MQPVVESVVINLTYTLIRGHLVTSNQTTIY